MIRALVALLGFAAAAALLAIAPNAGSLTGDHLWYVAGVWAAAGLVAGFFYQAGGVRRPGVRFNAWMFVLTFLPWTLLAAAAIVQVAEPFSSPAGWARDILPDRWLAHWVIAMSALAFGSGLLLALSLLEPLVQRGRDVVVADDAGVTSRGEPVVAQPVARREAVPANDPQPVDAGRSAAIVDRPTDLDEQPTPAEVQAERDAAPAEVPDGEVVRDYRTTSAEAPATAETETETAPDGSRIGSRSINH